MHRQITLWPEPQHHALKTEMWQKLHPEAQRAFVATLARLIAKALFPKSLADPQEVNHESK